MKLIEKMKMISKDLLKIYARKAYDFACISLFALAAIGGVAYLFYDHHALFGVAAVAVSGMAIPYIIKRVKSLLS